MVIPKRALRIDEVCNATGLGRTTIYLAIKNGHLCARKYGRSTIILSDDLERFLNALPALDDQARACGRTAPTDSARGEV